MDVYAVIPTYNRPQSLWRLLRRLDVPQERVLVINNGEKRMVQVFQQGYTVINHPERPPNIQRMWNIGLDWASREAQGREHAVLVLNDDVEALGPLAEPLAAALAQSGAQVAYPSMGTLQHFQWTKRLPIVQDEAWDPELGPEDPKPWTPEKNRRMTGWCFMLRGDSAATGPGLRLDEDFAWYYGDNDLEWRAQIAGGTVEVSGIEVRHHHPNEQTLASPELKAQTRVDRRTFELKWGRPAW